MQEISDLRRRIHKLTMGNSNIHIAGDNNRVILSPGAETRAATAETGAAPPPPDDEQRSSRRKKWCVFR
jgi:hypothetical protein